MPKPKPYVVTIAVRLPSGVKDLRAATNYGEKLLAAIEDATPPNPHATHRPVSMTVKA